MRKQYKCLLSTICLFILFALTNNAHAFFFGTGDIEGFSEYLWSWTQNHQVIEYGYQTEEIDVEKLGNQQMVIFKEEGDFDKIMYKSPKTIGYQFTLENPYDIPMGITLAYSDQYELPIFAPFEKRIYTEKDLHGYKIGGYHRHSPASYITFSNGKHALLETTSITVPPLLDIYSEKHSSMSHEEVTELNHQLYYYFQPRLKQADKEKCIQEALDRYRQECRKYHEKYPRFKLKEYSTNEVIEQLETMGHLPISFPFFKTWEKQNFPPSRFFSAGLLIRDLTRLNRDNRECPFCHQQTPFMSLYCIHCHKMILPDVHYGKDITQCIWCNQTYEQTKPTCKCPFPEEVKYKKIYDNDNNLYQVKEIMGNRESISYLINRKIPQDNPLRTKKPDLFFDSRILYYSFKPLETLPRIIERLNLEEYRSSTKRPALYTKVFCDSQCWESFDTNRKDQLIGFCLQGGTLTIYHSDHNETRVMGTGKIIYAVGHYKDSVYCLERLSLSPTPMNFVLYEDHESYGHSPRDSRKPDYLDPPFQYRDFRLYGAIILTIMAASLGICYCLAIRKREVKSLMLIPVSTIAATTLLILTYAYFYGLTPSISEKTVYIHDQSSQKTFQKTNIQYFPYIRQSEKTIKLNKKIDELLYRDYRLNDYPKKIKNPTSYNYCTWHEKKDSIILKNHIFNHDMTIIEINSVLDESGTMQYETETNTLTHTYPFTLKNCVLHTKNGYFQADHLLPGQAIELTPIKSETFHKSVRSSSLSSLKNHISYLRYLQKNNMDYVISQKINTQSMVSNNKKKHTAIIITLLNKDNR